MARRTTADDLRLAAEWLECYEPDTDEGDRCARVAQWLRVQADERDVRSIARRFRVSKEHAAQALRLAGMDGAAK